METAPGQSFLFGAGKSTEEDYRFKQKSMVFHLEVDQVQTMRSSWIQVLFSKSLRE